MKAAAAIGGAVLLLGAACGGAEEPGDLPLGRQAFARATFTPSVHLFAEPVVGHVEVVVDRDHLDPARVRLDAEFLPYDVEETARRRLDRGRFTVLEYDFVLRCLRLDCIPEILPSAAGEAESGRGERRAFALPAAEVLYDDGGEPRTLATARWPELVSVSRIKQSDVPSFGFVFKTNVTPLPEPDYAVPPRLLGAGLLVGGFALLAFPALLVVAWLRRRRPPPPELVEEQEELSPLERALRLVEWARTRENGTERREALEVLAVELDVEERRDLAAAARRLAWSPSAPSPEAAERLADEVRGTP